MIPVEIPDDGNERVINVSGGRTSAYMLRAILDAHGGKMPPRTRAIYTNTGKEREETLDFLKAMQQEWNVEITWLEYRYDYDAKGGRKNPKNTFSVVDYGSAARHGEPFAQLIEKSEMLPYVVARKCTSELKVKTINRYMSRTLGIRKHRSLLGIRYDEPRRAYRILKEKDCRSELPLFHAKVTEDAIMDYWRHSSFDLSLRADQGNCDLCFLKGRSKLIRLIREKPSMAEWWDEQEKKITATRDANKAPITFNKNFSYEDLVRAADMNERQQGLFDDDDDLSLSCFCGD